MKARTLVWGWALAVALGVQGVGQEFPQVSGVEWQPLAAQVRRLMEAMEHLGTPLLPADRRGVEELVATEGGAEGVKKLQGILDRYCLVGVHINPESRVKVSVGQAKPELVEQGWRQFLVKVHNEAGVTAELRAASPNALSLSNAGKRTASDNEFKNKPEMVRAMRASDLWMDLQMFNQQPLRPTLGGLVLEYRILQVYSKDEGKREGKLAFNVGQGTQDIGFRNEVDLLFDVKKSSALKLRIKDESGKGTTAGLLVRDAAGRVYPSQAKRLAPDFAFHPQVYRADGESLSLPAGSYTVDYTRGPEYRAGRATVEMGGRGTTLEFKLERWIDPSLMGWWSGDHHIHAAGCAHYTKPTEGVHAPDMMRHILGEDLKVGCNLTWGPCFDYQKQFFTGKDDRVSKHPYILHYDIEVSGFGSHQSGHLCLLQLKEQMYPGGDSMAHWPSLCLNTLKWAKKQGAVVGPAHSGWGLEVETSELPNLAPAPFNGIGANEYIVDVTHQVPGPDGKLVPAVDFLSTVDTPYVWELNIWYHTLNVGYRTRISGETDFPCIYGERVGLGRSYVKLDQRLDYAAWCEGIRAGRNYVGDGRSHLIGFKVNDVEMGVKGSELRLPAPGQVRVRAKAAALLESTPRRDIQERPYNQQPYWHVERARIGATRKVPVEVVVNGRPVARKELDADGDLEDLEFDVPIEQSSWVAVRILPSSHTNPIFVLVGDQPIRASRKSAQWCLEGVDRCWTNKQRFIKPAEQEDARVAYEHARTAYRQLWAESKVD